MRNAVKPFEIGYQMGFRGQDPSGCPYQPGSQEWLEWRSFYARGQRMARDLGFQWGEINGKAQGFYRDMINGTETVDTRSVESGS